MTVADELSALDTTISRQLARQEIGIGLGAIGLVGVAGIFWVYAGLPGPELDHAMIQAQAREHGGIGGVAFAALFAILAAGVLTTLRASARLEALYAMQSSLRSTLALEIAKRRRVQQASAPSTQGDARSRTPISSAGRVDDTNDQLQAMTNTLLAVAAIEAISQSDPVPAPAPAFTGDGGSFGGGGATGDFSTNE